MLLLAVLLFMGILIGITVNMISAFLPFMHKIRDIEDYYLSRYAAISALEQWLLATKYKQSWFLSTGNTSTRPEGILQWDVRARTNKFADGSIGYLYGTGNNKEKSKIDYMWVSTIFFSKDMSSAFSGERIFSSVSPDVNIDYDLWVPTHYAIHGLDNRWEQIFGDSWESVFSDPNIIRRLSGLNLAQQNGIFYVWIDHKLTFSDGTKVPLLEYSFLFSGDDVGDEKFYIVGKAQVGEYTTEMNVAKPTKDLLNPDFKSFLFPVEP